MKKGHVVGTKREKANGSDWYKSIETETLRQLEAQSIQDTQARQAFLTEYVNTSEDELGDENFQARYYR